VRLKNLEVLRGFLIEIRSDVGGMSGEIIVSVCVADEPDGITLLAGAASESARTRETGEPGVRMVKGYT